MVDIWGLGTLYLMVSRLFGYFYTDMIRRYKIISTPRGIVEIARGSVAALSTPRQNAAVHLPCVSILERTGHFLAFYKAVPCPLIFLVRSLGGLILKEVWTAKSLMKLLANFRL